MRHFFSFFLLLITIFSPLDAAYKILVNSYDSKEAADQNRQIIQDRLNQNAYFTSHQDEEGYEIYSRKLNKFYVVTIEPFENREILSNILMTVQKANKTAFISTSSKKRTPKATAPIIQEVQPVIAELPAEATTPEEPAPIQEVQPVEPVKTVEIKPAIAEAPKIDNSKYLRKNIDNSAANILEPYMYFIIVVFMMLLVLGIVLLKRKQTKDENSALSDILLNSDLQNDTPSIIPQGYLSADELKVDLHSHLIPGIDDGSSNIQESVALIKRLKNLGYEKIITTPHIMKHRYPNSSAVILDGLAALKKRLAEEGINIQLEAAAEYFLDEHLMELIAKRDILTFGENYLLFEMSYINHPANLEEMVQTMIHAGYTPVLAHPERYIYMSKNFSKYVTLKALGVRFQLNVNSLGGYYSAEVQKIAQKLVDAGMINFVGSDTHRSRHVDAFESVIKTQGYRELFKKNNILNNTLKKQ